MTQYVLLFLIMELTKQLFDHFVKSKLRVEWLYGDLMHVYVRKSYRFLVDGDNSRFEECLDIANIQVDDDQQGKGLFTALLKSIVEDYPEYNIYVDSIQNPAVEHICKKFGFVFLNRNPDDDCTNMILLKRI
jgi:hypothetical protein